MKTLTLGGTSEAGSGAEERRGLFLSPAPPEDFFIFLSLLPYSFSLSYFSNILFTLFWIFRFNLYMSKKNIFKFKCNLTKFLTNNYTYIWRLLF